MAVTTAVRLFINKVIRPFNIRLETWTSFDREQARIKVLQANGALNRPVYPLTAGMACFKAELLTDAYSRHQDEIECLLDPARNRAGYAPKNDFFSVADAVTLYLMIRTLKPKRVVEIGCGNSTRVTWQAIRDGSLSTQIVAIDPSPRADIVGLVNDFYKCTLEEVDDMSVFEDLGPNDVLFIDSSHKLCVGSDVARLYCQIIPALKGGVVVHAHDIFLPYEYPEALAFDHPDWNEQYILHVLLLGWGCDVLWPGYYVQHNRKDIRGLCPLLFGGTAQSFWFRK